MDPCCSARSFLRIVYTGTIVGMCLVNILVNLFSNISTVGGYITGSIASPQTQTRNKRARLGHGGLWRCEAPAKCTAGQALIKHIKLLIWTRGDMFLKMVWMRMLSTAKPAPAVFFLSKKRLTGGHHGKHGYDGTSSVPAPCILGAF